MAGVADPAAVWRHADNALTRRTPRSLVVLGAASNEPIVLDGVALAIWDQFAAPAADARVAELLGPELATDGTDIRDVVVSTREALLHVGAIVEA